MLKLRVFLESYSVDMVVTYCVTTITPTCSSQIEQFLDTLIVLSSDEE